MPVACHGEAGKEDRESDRSCDGGAHGRRWAAGKVTEECSLCEVACKISARSVYPAQKVHVAVALSRLAQSGRAVEFSERKACEVHGVIGAAGSDTPGAEVTIEVLEHMVVAVLAEGVWPRLRKVRPTEARSCLR